MLWEAETIADSIGPGWHPDPLDSSRLRWWDGTSWCARVARLEVGSDAISWHAGISDIAPPNPPTDAPSMPTVVAEEEPPPPALPVAATDPWSSPAEGMPQEPTRPKRPHPRRNRRSWALLGTALLIVAVGAGAGTAMLGGDERPTLEPTLTYRDDDADFALRYPTEWNIDERTRGEGVIFAVGTKDALPLDKNTLSVVAGTSTDQPFVPLHALVSQTADELIAALPNFRLVSATEAHLADAPAFRLEFVDSTTKPAKRLVQVVGRTTSGRPLAVTLTVREPRTEPTEAALQEFLASITSN